MFRGGCEFAGRKFAVKKSRFSRGLIFAVYLGLFNAKYPINDEEYVNFTFCFEFRLSNSEIFQKNIFSRNLQSIFERSLSFLILTTIKRTICAKIKKHLYANHVKCSTFFAGDYNLRGT